MNHGFLVLDKTLGMSSAKAVSEVKRLLGCKKIGHGGTLDPLASGVLPLAVGEATKAFDYVASAIKQYRFTVAFGEERSTGDAEGEVVQRTDAIPTQKALWQAIPAFLGVIQQVPPVYSALKIQGKRAYALARAGEVVEMPPRPVEIHALALETFTGGAATFTVTCGKGTYVRSLAQDIARKVNSLGYVSMLRRTAVGKFTEKQAISLEKCKELVHSGALLNAWVPLELALDDIPAIEVDTQQALKIRQGQAIPFSIGDGCYLALSQRVALAMCRVEGQVLRAVRVFNIGLGER